MVTEETEVTIERRSENDDAVEMRMQLRATYHEEVKLESREEGKVEDEGKCK